MHGMHLINNLSHDRPILQSDWCVEIPQRRTENSSQVHQTLFLILEVGSGHETTEKRESLVHGSRNHVHYVTACSK